MKRTTLAVALATGALAVPAVSLAAGDSDDPATQTPSTTPVQQEEQQPQQRDREDCPEHEGGDGSSGSSETQL